MPNQHQLDQLTSLPRPIYGQAALPNIALDYAHAHPWVQFSVVMILYRRLLRRFAGSFSAHRGSFFTKLLLFLLPLL